MGLFRPEEIAVALDVFDGAIAGAATSGDGTREPDYSALGVDADDVLAGWVCWGPTPCTAGTYDLYWIVVDPAFQGRGLGTALLEAMERRLAGRARLIVVETSGRAEYAPTRAFYEARGYRAEARIEDFYAPGDDLVVYTKAIAATRPRQSLTEES